MAQNPTLGRIVLYKKPGFIEVPAIITRIWTETCVNLTVFHHDGPPESRQSVSFLDYGFNPEGAATVSEMWRWPPRPPLDVTPMPRLGAPR